MSVQFYQGVVTDAAPDSERPGHIRARIPELFGEDEAPFIIPPLFTGWKAGGWQASPSATMPSVERDGSSEVLVLIARLATGTFRWFGTDQVNELLGPDFPDVSGAVAPDGRSAVRLIGKSADSRLQLRHWNTERVAVQSAIDLVVSSNIAHLLLGATRIRLSSTVDGSVPPSTEPLVLGTTFLTDLLAAVTEVKVALSSLGFPVTSITTLETKLTASLSAKAPYLSNIAETE